MSCRLRRFGVRIGPYGKGWPDRVKICPLGKGIAHEADIAVWYTVKRFRANAPLAI